MSLTGGTSRPWRWGVTWTAVLVASLIWMPTPKAEPITSIRNNGSSANRVDLVVLGDGYTSAEISSGKYANDVESFVQGVFAQEPFKEYQYYFNVTRIDVTSPESGADKPASGIFKNTALDAAYFCSSIQRLICVNTTKVNTVIANSGIAANARDMIVVLVNDAEYGGSGGSIAVASTHTQVVELVLHEAGHSFGQLADEYGGPPPPSCSTNEPSAANATRQTARELIKWNSWIDPGTPVPTGGTTNGVPGLYEGAVYCDTGAYRPTFNSKMRSLGLPFHDVNEEQIVKRIYNFVSPIDDSSPAGSVLASGPSQAFSVTVPQPFSHNLDVAWRVDGVFQGNGTQFTANGLAPGQRIVTATVTDFTPKVRNDPGQLLNEVRTWTVNVTSPSFRVDMNGDGNGDAFVYKPTTGQWARQVTQGGGGFVGTNSGWAPGWSVYPARFNTDAQTDFFLFSATTGEWFKMLNNGTGFSAQATGAWWPGWQRHVMDLDGDGISDLFLYDPVSGQWFKCISTPTGFTYHQGGWAPGWELYPLNLNGDAREDFFLFNRSTGQWVWVTTEAGSGFSYPLWGGWAPVWNVYPGDFNGDNRSDLLLHNPNTGQFYVATNTGSGFIYELNAWSLGWTPMVVDLDANNVADLFLYNKTTGQWYELLSDGFAHFTSVGSGFWSPSWDLYPTDYNGDRRTDLLLYNPTTGQYYQAWNLFLGSFSYFSGGWDTGLTIVVSSPSR